MNNRTFILILLSTSLAVSCLAPRKAAVDHSRNQRHRLDSIRKIFTGLQASKGFSIEFTKKDLSQLGLEIETDSIRYTYFFDNDKDLQDSLYRYGYDVGSITGLVNAMKHTQCTWITTQLFFEKRIPKRMVLLSYKLNKKGFIRRQSYVNLVYFDEDKPFDRQERLLDVENGRVYMLNNKIFYRLDNRVFYNLAGNFR